MLIKNYLLCEIIWHETPKNIHIKEKKNTIIISTEKYTHNLTCVQNIIIRT